MTKGKASSAQNSRLRRELKGTEEARRRLERRLREAELDRDDAMARLAERDGAAHPGIVAERIRADAASEQTHVRVAAYRDQLSVKLDRIAELFAEGVKQIRDDGAMRWTEDQYEELRALLGRERFVTFMDGAAPEGLGRAAKRAVQFSTNIPGAMRTGREK